MPQGRPVAQADHASWVMPQRHAEVGQMRRQSSFVDEQAQSLYSAIPGLVKRSIKVCV